MKMHLTVAAAVLAAALPAAAADSAGRKPKKYDPDEKICETRAVTGSRLQTVRVCYTAREWEEVKMQEKVGLMRRQYNGSSGARGEQANTGFGG